MQNQIEPHKLTKPFQLYAVWLIGMISLVSAFIVAAAKIAEPPWACSLFVIAAVAVPVIGFLTVYRLQTKYRPHFMEDRYYYEWEKRQAPQFEGFNPVPMKPGGNGGRESGQAGSAKSLKSYRIKRYEGSKGLFLVHSWRPSRTKGQVADITIRLQQHRNGPLTDGSIAKVVYELGPMFFSDPVEKKNANQDFRLDVSAYGPMLCVADVHLKDGSPPLRLERYINF